MTRHTAARLTTRILIYCFTLIVVGCALLSRAPQSASSAIPARDLLSSDKIPPDNYGAYGYLVFTKRPNNNELSRYVKVCEAYNRNLESVSKYSDIASSSLMPTYWLATRSYQLNTHNPRCRIWVESYDYARAKRIASSVSALNSRGPLLVAWNKAYENASIGEQALILDLSNFSEADFDRAFGIWMDRITRDPSTWQNGFNLVLAREAFRNFLEKYGDDIIKAISTAKETFG